MTLRGIDISNWQGEITPQTAACLAPQVDVAVVRASLESMDLVGRAQRQMQALKDAGIEVHAYLWFYPSWDSGKTVTDAMREYGSFDLPWWWVDMEETSDVTTPASNVSRLGSMLNGLRGAGRQVGIYTGAWWWNDPRYMAGAATFRNVPLWVADYNGNADLSSWTRFGGWTEAMGKQYSSSGNLCGITPLDLDTFSDAVKPKPEPLPDERDERIRELVNGLTLNAGSLDALALELQNASNRARAYAQGARDAVAKWGS